MTGRFDISDVRATLALLALFLGAGGNAEAACKLTKMADLPVTMVDSKPMVSAKINGADALFVADSGAFYSMISPASAVQFRLKTTPAPMGFYLNGVGGRAEASLATVKDFNLAGIPVKNLEFLVGGGDLGGGGAGLIGQNVFHIADVEYDLAQGVIRLMREDDCRKAQLAYWAQGPDANPSVMDIEYTTARSPHTTGAAYVNGVKVKVVFDTGAGASLLSRRAAERVGIKTEGPDAKEAGYSRGIGRNIAKTWIVPVDSFKIGDEEIRHTQLRVEDLGNSFDIGDMLLGADFFLSHHIYVATKQGKLFFTYNGGRVFNLNAVAALPNAANGVAPMQAVPSTAPPDSATPSAAAPLVAQDESDSDKAMHAAEFSRRGAALVARRNFAQAIADLDRACALAPLDSDYLYERGIAKAESGAVLDAAGDFTEAIRLQPDHVPALLARAELRLHGVNADNASVVKQRSKEQIAADRSAALEDLNAADRAAAKEADARLRMAGAYRQAGALQSTVNQLDLWITAHEADARLAGALTERCWARASLNNDLSKALDDCNNAYRHLDKKDKNSTHTLDTRGVVRMLLGDYEKSIDDFNTALKLRPNDACALAGRGEAKKQLGDTSAGSADTAAAAALFAAPGGAQDTQRCVRKFQFH